MRDRRVGESRTPYSRHKSGSDVAQTAPMVPGSGDGCS
eukprot:COSAG02_NODE_61102_length_269_cov_0.911765_1_plen_37_part_01